MFIWRSRPNLRCKLVERPDGIAGIRLDRSGLRPGDEDSFHSFKKFEISFEQKRGQEEETPPPIPLAKPRCSFPPV